MDEKETTEEPKDIEAVFNEIKKLRTDIKIGEIVSFFRELGALIISVGFAGIPLGISLRRPHFVYGVSIYVFAGIFFLFQSSYIKKPEVMGRKKRMIIIRLVRDFPLALVGIIVGVIAALVMVS